MTKKENDDKTRKVGKGKPPKGVEFTTDNQPSPQAKSEGKRKKRQLKELAEALITGEAKNKAKEIAESLGIDLSEAEYNLQIIMTLKQIQIAIEQGDSRAYSVALDRILGKPKQTTELTGKDGKDLIENQYFDIDFSVLTDTEFKTWSELNLKLKLEIPISEYSRDSMNKFKLGQQIKTSVKLLQIQHQRAFFTLALFGVADRRKVRSCYRSCIECITSLNRYRPDHLLQGNDRSSLSISIE